MTPELPLPAFVLVTGNAGKQHEVERIMEYRPPCEPIDLPELQSLDVLEILRAKAEAAWQHLGRALVVDESALDLDALNGFPGPLVKWMLAAVGPEGIARTAHRLQDVRATARCALLYRDAETEVLAVGEPRGRLVREPRGDGGFGWDPVFQPDGSAETYGEMAPATKDSISHRGKAWLAFESALASAGIALAGAADQT